MSDLIPELLADKNAFDSYVHTPWPEALKKLKERESDLNLDSYVRGILPSVAPKPLREGANMVLSRHVATPNYEMHRFLQCQDALDLHPLILEYREDKYVNANELKHALAELCFYKGLNKDGRPILSRRSIIDRNISNGQKLSSLTTRWGTPLIEFHHQLFSSVFPDSNLDIIDVSELYAALGGRASAYYKGYLSLFLKHNILFENYIFSKKEKYFMSEVMLPAFVSIVNETGIKPLIVSMGPAGNESDIFWTSYPPDREAIVDKTSNT